MSERHLKTCSTFLVISEIQIKTTLKFYQNSIRNKVAKSKTQETPHACKGMKQEEFFKCKLVQPLWKAIWHVIRKLGIHLPQDPTIPALGIFSKDGPKYH